MTKSITDKSYPTYNGSYFYINCSRYTTEQLQRMMKTLRGSDKVWVKINLQQRQNKNGQWKK